MPHDLRAAICDFVCHYASLSELACARLLAWIGLSPRRYHDWRERYGRADEHHALVPRNHSISAHERKAIINFADEYPLEGDRRLTFVTLDRDLGAVSPSPTYRVLKDVGLLHPWNAKPTKKGDGFAQPLEPHDHWQVDFSYLNTAGTFYSPCSVLDGCSRAILAWDIRAAIKEADAEIVLQRAHEDYPGAHPRIITDNGAQFVAKDFKAFIRHFQSSHVDTSPHYPRSNGKIERFHRTLEAQTIRPHDPVDARGGQTRHRHLHRPIQPSSPAQRPRLNRSDRSPRQPPPHHLPATRSKNGSRAPSP